MENVLFYLLHLSLLIVLSLMLFLFSMTNKKQLHSTFIYSVVSLIIWNIGYLLEAYARMHYGYTVMLFVYIWYLGLCFTPAFLLITSIVFDKTKINYKRYLFLFIPPVVSFIMIITNERHHLFFQTFSVYNTETVVCNYFIIHSIFMYGYMIVCLFNFLYSSIKNSGFFQNSRY